MYRCLRHVLPLTVVLVVLITSHAAQPTAAVETAAAVIAKDHVAAMVRPQYLSTTIDVSLLSHTLHCNLSDPRVRTLARQLAQDRTYLRIGGTKGDKIWYALSEPPRAPPNQEYEWTLNATVWDAVNEFAAAVGFEIVFGINAGAGPRTPSTGSISSSNSISGDAGPWTADNALEMIKYNQEHGFPVVGYEFGNEPDLFSSALNISVAPSQYAKDIALFTQTVKSVDASLITVAPDVDYIPLVGDFAYLELLLPAANKLNTTWDVVTWHFYPTFAPEHYSDKNLPFFLQWLISRPGLMLEPKVLDMVGQWGDDISSLRDQHMPAAEAWLGETGSAVGGGAQNVSNVFVDGFEWLDKLGQLATRGQSLVFRQTLCGYRYGFINFDLQPLPDYFTTVLFKRLVGVAALATNVTSSNGLVRGYAFCARPQPSAASQGAVVMILMNMNSATAAQVAVSAPKAMPGPRHDYLLTAPAASLTSSTVLLNGVALAVAADGQLPAMPPRVVSSTEASTVQLPPRSYGFFVWPQANAPACKTAEQRRSFD